MLEYIAKFEELCNFSTIYQWNPDEVWKCVKFEGSLRKDILATVGPIEIWNFATLVNKCKLVEECNKKLKLAKSNAHRKRMAPDTQDFGDTLPLKKQFQSDWYEGEKPQGLIMRQKC